MSKPADNDFSDKGQLESPLRKESYVVPGDKWASIVHKINEIRWDDPLVPGILGGLFGAMATSLILEFIKGTSDGRSATWYIFLLTFCAALALIFLIYRRHNKLIDAKDAALNEMQSVRSGQIYEKK